MSIRETLISARQAKAWRARADRYAQWSAQFVKPNGWTVISKDEQKTCPRNARMTNEQRGKLEQFEVWNDKPQHLFAYVSFHEREVFSRANKPARETRDIRATDEARVKVWTGDMLGFGTCGKVYRSNFGDRRASINVMIAGEHYSGTAYIDAGDYCRLRRCKS